MKNTMANINRTIAHISIGKRVKVTQEETEYRRAKVKKERLISISTSTQQFKNRVKKARTKNRLAKESRRINRNR